MKQPGTPMEHLGGNYLLVEGGYNDDTRTITLLAEPGNDAFTHPETAHTITWRDQGDWYPIAKWAVGFVTLQDGAYEGQRLLIDEIFDRFQSDRPEACDVAWTLLDEDGFVGTLEEILPMGLAVTVFGDEEEAEDADTPRGVVPINNLPQFLTHLAREGYAGAMWNERQPVFFCIDDDGEVQFLRVSKSDAGEMAMDILSEEGDWMPYDGVEEIEFLENREACDRRLVSTFGHRPVIDWPEDGRLWTVGPTGGVPGLVKSEEDDITYGVLFSDEDNARSWNEDMDASWVSFPVTDVSDFLQREELHGCGGLLNPGGHRVRNGVLWCDGERVVLDSFSGFWALNAEGFEPLE